MSVYYQVHTGGIMNVSTKELRIQPGKIIDQVIHGEEITVTFRGKALAKIIPLHSDAINTDVSTESIFGMWNSHVQEKTVEEEIRELRLGRQF